MKEINLSADQLEYFEDDFYGDFFDFFANLLKFKTLTGQIKEVHYLTFVLNLNKEAKTATYKLVFDKDLNFIEEKSFSKNHDLAELKKGFSYTNAQDQIKNFNVELAKIFDRYDLDKEKLAYQLS